jgi:hypothetical protein
MQSLAACNDCWWMRKVGGEAALVPPSMPVGGCTCDVVFACRCHGLFLSLHPHTLDGLELLWFPLIHVTRTRVLLWCSCLSDACCTSCHSCVWGLPLPDVSKVVAVAPRRRSGRFPCGLFSPCVPVRCVLQFLSCLRV